MSNQPSAKGVIGIIGGSGVYDIDALQDKQWRKIESSFGEPSDECLFGHLDGQPMVFLPRHGRGHSPGSPRRGRRGSAGGCRGCRGCRCRCGTPCGLVI